MNNDTIFAVAVFKALADETRFEIVQMLSQGEMCACKILERFNFTQPTLSYHMRILTAAGLVNARREGAWIHYSLNRESLKVIGNQFQEIYDATVTDEKISAVIC